MADTTRTTLWLTATSRAVLAREQERNGGGISAAANRILEGIERMEIRQGIPDRCPLCGTTEPPDAAGACPCCTLG